MKTWSAAGGVKDTSTQEQEVAENVDGEHPMHDPAAPVEVGAGGPSDAGWHSAEAGIWCLKEAQYKYIRGVHKPLLQTPDPFAVGGLLHAGRATWFGEKFSTSVESVARVKAAMEEAEASYSLPVSAKAKADAAKYVDEYISHWSARAKPQPVAAEYLVGPAPLQAGDQFPLHRTARLDDVSYYPEALNGLCIGEAKTTSGSIADCINQYTLHGQPLIQFVLWKTCKRGEALHGPAKGIMLDIIKKGYGKERSQFARHFVQVTDRVVSWYVKNMREYLRDFASLDWDTDAPRNIMACTRMVGRARMACEYRDLCVHGKNAAGNYVMRGDKSLSSWRPSETQKIEPWD